MITAYIISFIIVSLLVMWALRIISYQKYKKSYNNVRFYVSRDKDKTLWFYSVYPIREDSESFAPNKRGRVISNSSCFENVGLNLNNYKDLKWEDGPVEVFLNLED